MARLASPRRDLPRFDRRQDPQRLDSRRAGPRRRFDRRLVMAAGIGVSVLLGTPLLAGCGVGQDTQTSNQQPSVNGAAGNAGTIAVRNIELATPESANSFYSKGSEAPLLGTVVNTGSSEDELVSITSPAASKVEIEGQAKLPAQVALRVVPPAKTGDANTNLTRGQLRITLQGLVDNVMPGKTIRVTFLFRQSGELTLDVPIAIPESEG